MFWKNKIRWWDTFSVFRSNNPKTHIVGRFSIDPLWYFALNIAVSSISTTFPENTFKFRFCINSHLCLPELLLLSPQLYESTIAEWGHETTRELHSRCFYQFENNWLSVPMTFEGFHSSRSPAKKHLKKTVVIILKIFGRISETHLKTENIYINKTRIHK